jgi:predicted lactoylglutathione lyase
MSTKIFVNLPVKDLKRSMDFFKALGYTFNLQFTNEKAACLVITENIYTMLITHNHFKNFTPKKITDAKDSTEVMVALSCENRTQVDDLFNKAIAAGGTETRPTEDHGFMYGRAFNDLDGHIWELFWMDPKGFPEK